MQAGAKVVSEAEVLQGKLWEQDAVLEKAGPAKQVHT